MNLLINDLPKTVLINDKEYEINTDHRAGIALEIMINKGEVNPYKLAFPYFGKHIPKDIEATIEAIKGFYLCGKVKDEKETNKAKMSSNNKIPYSFDVDDRAIIADFWRYYSIDLTQESLHWWVFRALLDALPEKSEFKQRVYYRTCDLKNLSKSERKRITKIRKLIEINPSKRSKMTLEERNKRMKDYVSKRIEEANKGVK